VPAAFFEVALARAQQIDGFLLACFVDASTGMILASAQHEEDLNLAVAAAGAADVASVLSMMTGALALDGGLQDVIVTLSSHYHLIRLVEPAPGQQFLLLVTLRRAQANLGLVHREIRDLCAALIPRQPLGLPQARETAPLR